MKAKVELEIDKNDLSYELKELVSELATPEIKKMITQIALPLVKKENYKKLKVDENGYSKSNCLLYISASKNDLIESKLNIPIGMPKKYQPTGSDLIYRPKSLSGLENNNGWISIESEEDLPKEFGSDYWALMNGKINMINRSINNQDFWKKHVTHYQKIIRPNPPIF